MRRVFSFILLLMPMVFGCGRPDKNIATVIKKLGDDNSVDIEIPSGWMEKVRGFKYNRDTRALITDFDGFVRPVIKLAHPEAVHVDEDYGRVLNSMFVDLDGEPGEEMISLIGWDITCPYLCVFKQYDGNWHLIYIEDTDTSYTAATLNVANCFSRNKTFYYRYIASHGTGFRHDNYCFYKLIDNKVYKCLDIAGDSFSEGWGSYIDFDIKMTFEFNGDESDGVSVNYNYNYYPGSFDRNGCTWCSNPDMPLLKDDCAVLYSWSVREKTYKLNKRKSVV